MLLLFLPKMIKIIDFLLLISLKLDSSVNQVTENTASCYQNQHFHSGEKLPILLLELLVFLSRLRFPMQYVQLQRLYQNPPVETISYSKKELLEQ